MKKFIAIILIILSAFILFLGVYWIVGAIDSGNVNFILAPLVMISVNMPVSTVLLVFGIKLLRNK